jgi:hypothetical protein
MVIKHSIRSEMIVFHQNQVTILKLHVAPKLGT